MASGKSLELAQIKPEPSPMCTCGEPYKTHMRKDGTALLKKFDTPKHAVMEYQGMNRAQLRRLRKGH